MRKKIVLSIFTLGLLVSLFYALTSFLSIKSSNARLTILFKKEFFASSPSLQDKASKEVYEYSRNLNSLALASVLSIVFLILVFVIADNKSGVKEKFLKNQKVLENLLAKKTKELEEERAKNIQESKLRSIGEIAAGVAHEINNPLSVIKPRAKLIKKILLKENYSDKKVLDGLDLIVEMGERMSEIVSKIKGFSREQSNVEKKVISINQIIESSLNLTKQKFVNRKIDLRLNLAKDMPLVFVKDVEISQVIINVINNALYVVEGQSSDQEKWIQIDSYVKDGNVVTEISNSGPKISPEIVDKIMQPFFTTKPVGEGTGLGLSISSGIIKSMGGLLLVNLDKENTCFVIFLPHYDIPKTGVA